jgi:hypothetical protein
MDTPQRANAAQLAARSIKAKPKGRTSRPGLSQPNSSNSVPQFAPMPGQGPNGFNPGGGGGGLFGGAVQAPSTFNFSTGSGPSLSFPPTNFGSTPSSASMFGGNTSSAPETERVEDTRNPKRQFQGASQSGQQNAAFETPNLFGQQKDSTNMFGGSAAPASNGFSFGNSVSQSFPPAAASSQPASNPFNFSASAAPKSPFSFTSASAQSSAPAPSSPFGNGSSTADKPSSNPFSFGQTSQTSTSTPAINFGSTPTTSAPVSTGWNFNSTSSTTAPASSDTGFKFDSTTTNAPASSGFKFNRTPAAAAPASPAINFGSKADTIAPASPGGFSFGSTAKPAESTNNLFGNTASQPASPSFGPFGATTKSQSPNLFAHLNQPTPSPTEPLSTQEQGGAKADTNYFASQTQKPAASPFSFGGQEQKPATPTTNTFGGQQSTPDPITANLFGGGQQSTAQPAAAKPTSNLFANSGKTSDLFGKPSGTPAKPADSSSGTQEQAPAKTDLFGNLGQNTTKANNSLFQSQEQTPAKPSSTPFGSFGQTPAKSVNNNNVFNTTPQAPPKPNPFANLNAPAPAASTESSETASKPATTNGLFGSQPGKSNTPSNLFGGSSTPATSSSEPLSTLNQPLRQPAPQASNTMSNGIGSKPSANMFSANKAQPPQSQATSTVQSSSSSAPIQAAPLLTSKYSAHVSHTPAVSSRLREVQSAEADNIEKDDDAPDEPIHPESFIAASGKNNFINVDGDPKKYPERFPGMEYASKYPIEKMDAMIEGYRFTTEQKIEFYTGYRMETLNKALQRYFRNIAITDNIFPAMKYYNMLREVILQRTSADLKAIASGQVQAQKPTNRVRSKSPVREAPAPVVAKAAQAPKTNIFAQSSLTGKTPSLPPAQSSSPFKTAPSLPPPHSSPTKVTPSTTARQPSPPKFNPVASSQSSAPSSSSKGKRKGEDFTKDDYEAGEASSPLKRAKMQSSVGSNTSNLFKNALNSPAKPLPAQGTLEKAAAATPEKPKVNPFAKLPGTSTPAKTAPPSFSFGATSTTPKASPSKPASGSLMSFGTESTTSKASPAKPIFGASSATPAAPTTSGFKPPVFAAAGSNNFLSQFGAKAKDYEAENEKKLMEKAQDEDYDSDDDLEEWKANYKKKRAAELKKLEEAKTKNPGFVFKPTPAASSAKPAGGFVFKPSADTSSSEKPKSSGGFVFKPSTDAAVSEQPQSISEAHSSETSENSSAKASPFPAVAKAKPLFGQSSAASKPSSSSIFESLNSSRAATPTFSFGAPVPDTQSTAPKFDGMFGHLSKQNSDAGSNKENSDEDDGAESDSENKDPNYDPKADKRPDSPSTPVEETGAGIASTKKPNNPFAFGSSTPTPATKTGGLFGAPSSSGTSTPKPSLFDRIARDSNGQPIKDNSDEKENTKPAPPTNLFGSLNKPLESPSDKTWKPDSPIKFGSSTQGTDLTPAVVVQAATPTKPATPFGNLFGTSNTTPANGSGASTPSLFAGLNTAKPAATGVGFGFGAASGSSSLFPSAAGSGTTSRATTPGATTDGDSATESNDPDAEKHAQLDLSAQTPGEEDEKRLFEVRAKATQFDNAAWQVKGTGLLRVLKHNDTNATRILIRHEVGKIIMNKSLIADADYNATQKTVKLMTASEDGKGLETWLLQVKTVESAKELAEILEANKKAE